MRNRLIIWTLVFGIGISSLQADEQECCGSAYTESSHAACWTPYLPIAILVVAAIYLGTSKTGQRRHSSIGYSSHGGYYRRNCYDGLGPLSGRSPSSSSGYTYAKSYTRCKVCSNHY